MSRVIKIHREREKRDGFGYCQVASISAKYVSKASIYVQNGRGRKKMTTNIEQTKIVIPNEKKRKGERQTHRQGIEPL